MIRSGRTLAYAEHVDQYNFDALDRMELKIYE